MAANLIECPWCNVEPLLVLSQGSAQVSCRTRTCPVKPIGPSCPRPELACNVWNTRKGVMDLCYECGRTPRKESNCENCDRVFRYYVE